MFARPRKASEHLQRVPSIRMGGMGCGQQTVAAASIHSRVKQHWHCWRTASQAPLAHIRQQVAGGRPSACQASTRAPRMVVSAVSQQEHACTSTVVVVAHGASACHSVHPRGQPSIPAPRGTSDASARQRVGVSRPDKLSNTTRHQGSTASAVSTTSVAMQKSDAFLHLPPDLTNPPL